MDLFEVRRMAIDLLRQHGLGHWRVKFDRARARAGACLHDTREISLSAPLMRLQEPAQVRDTILHEIAHALTGPGHGHGAAWRATAARIGAAPSRLFTGTQAPRDWLGKCAAGHEFPRHRRPTGPMICTGCADAGAGAGALVTWRYKGARVPMTTAYRAAEASLRSRIALEAAGQRPA